MQGKPIRRCNPILSRLQVMPIGDFDIALYTLGGVGKMNYDLSWLMHQLHLTKNASNIIGFIFYIIVIIFLQASDAAYYQDWKSVKMKFLH